MRLRYTGIALFLLVALAVYTVASGGDRDAGYHTFRIKEGSQWAGPTLRRAEFWWGPTTRQDASMSFIFEEPAAHVSFSIKVFGLSMGRFSRAPAHHDSDRFVATYLEDGVRIRPYAYRNGEIVRGDTLAVEVPFGEPIALALLVTPEGTTYSIRRADLMESVSFIPREDGEYRRVKFKNFAHARGGQFREAPVEVSFSARLVW